MALAFIIIVLAVVVAVALLATGVLGSIVERYRGTHGEPPTTRPEHPSSRSEPDDPAALESDGAAPPISAP
jgi:hypothetical protein